MEGSPPLRPLLELSGVDPGPTDTWLLPPDSICWRCFGQSFQRLRLAYTSLYEHGKGQPELVLSCRSLGTLVGGSPARASDLLLRLEDEGLAQVEVGQPGLDEEAKASTFTLIRPRTPLACKAGHARDCLTPVSPTDPINGGDLPKTLEEQQALPSRDAKPAWAERDTLTGQERWRHGNYGANGWALAVESHRRGHPWLRSRDLADAIGVDNSTAYRILQKMVANHDAERDQDKRFRLTLRIPVSKEEYDEKSGLLLGSRPDPMTIEAISRMEYVSDEAARQRQDRVAAHRRAMRVVQVSGSKQQFFDAIRSPLTTSGERSRQVRKRSEQAAARRGLERALASADVPEPGDYHRIAEDAVRELRATQGALVEEGASPE